MKFEIEFLGGSGKACNVRFVGSIHANNEVLLGLFYEDTDSIVEAIVKSESGSLEKRLQGDFDFGDFISGELTKSHITLYSDSDCIKSRSYKVKTDELKLALLAWSKFKQLNRSGSKQIVVINGEYI